MKRETIGKLVEKTHIIKNTRHMNPTPPSNQNSQFLVCFILMNSDTNNMICDWCYQIYK